MKNAMYNFQMKYFRWGSGLPRRVHAGAHDWGQVLTFQGKSCSHFSGHLPAASELHGNCAEGSTESASMIEFCVQGSIKAEPPWFVPLPERNILANRWKSALRFLRSK